MKQKWVIIAVFIAFAAVLVAVVGGKKKGSKAGPGATPAVGSTAGSGTGSGGPAATKVAVELMYSSEKKDWIEAAVGAFELANPDIDVVLTSKGSLEAATAILDGTSHPVLWSPADSLVLNLMASDWQTKFGRRPFAADGDAGPQQLLLSPLVFAVWEDRAKVLLAAAGGDTLTWKAIHDAVVSPRGWAAIGGKPGWGFVKLGHTDPNRSNSGLQALLLMTLEYYKQTSGLTVDQLLDEKYQAWIKDIERGVPAFEASTGTFMTDMIRFGPSKYDIAVVYESLAISQLENAQGRWGNLHVYYPPVTLWSDHPLVVLDAPWVGAPEQAAGRRVAAYLRGHEAQSMALRFGFRPADTSLPIKSTDGANPFVRLGSYGLALELPQAAPPPDGAVVRNLLMMWSRVARPQ